MGTGDAPVSLAELRRTAAQSRKRTPPVREAGPGLFDLFASSEPSSTAETAPALVIPRPVTPPQQAAAVEPSYTPDVVRAVLSPDLAIAPAALPNPDVLDTSPVKAVAPPQAQTWTVSGLVSHVRGMVEQGYARVTVEGEISNWRPAGSGHCYFTVKDAGAQLSAVMFRRQASLLRFEPHDGDAVKLHGQLSVYESRGQMQLIVEWMQQAGLGALLAEVQRLKERLRREGLLDRKRPLPPFPRCIGIVTSLRGAALRDIVKVCRRRHAAVQLLIYPAAVQGPNCASEVAAGLRWFNAHPEQVEVVLVARGGGSWEDLHGFDDELVARAIAGSTLPVITGLGHATDSTIADAAADVCAPTPSAAAELLTAAQHRIEEHVGRLHTRLLQAGRFELLHAQQRFARLGALAVLRRIETRLNRHSQRLDELQFRAHTALQQRFRSQANRHKLAEGRLGRLSPALRLQADRRRLEALRTRLEKVTASRIQRATRAAEGASYRLEALSPLRVLERGYALVYGPDGHLLRSSEGLQAGAEIRARLGQGAFRAQVLETTEGAGNTAA